ncbi:1786_t:CDS:2 [Entrophospora sp. SA101]|nr:1786_t:CDS:2 [Entrophospora sp. SA101]CAJ0906790.1 16762_t:CDS:2 [Entrophospora sp. SA101]
MVIVRYHVVTELQTPSNELIIEWGIYYGHEYNPSSGGLDIYQCLSEFNFNEIFQI